MTMRTNRRDAMKFGLAGAAGLALPQIMVRAAHADIPTPDIGNPGFHRFMLGGFEVTTLFDGGRPGDGPHPIFGEDQSAEDVAALMEDNFLPADRFVNGFTPTLVNTGSELVLFDTGLGAGARENGLGRTLERLQASGYEPSDVSIVVITHMHPDHVGGVMEAGQPAFPNARYVTGQAEFDHWVQNGESESDAVQTSIVPLVDKFSFIEDGAEVTGGITGMLAVGHTPGHMIFMIDSGERQLVVTADTANHFVASLQRPDWHVQFDMDKEQAVETRRRVFDMIAADRLPFIGYHMPFPGVGFVEPMGGGYRYIPKSYQFEL